VIRNYESPEPLILSVGEEDEVAIADVVKHIVKAMDFKGKVLYDNSKSDGQFKKTASNQKLKSLMPGLKFTPIKDGIEQTVKWFLENYESIRK